MWTFVSCQCSCQTETHHFTTSEKTSKFNLSLTESIIHSNRQDFIIPHKYTYTHIEPTRTLKQ